MILFNVCGASVEIQDFQTNSISPVDNLHITSSNDSCTPGTCLGEVMLIQDSNLRENFNLPKSFLTETEQGRTESAVVPMKLENNASEVLDACDVASTGHSSVYVGTDFNKYSFKEGFVSHRGPHINDESKLPTVEISSKAKVEEVNDAVEFRRNFHNVTVPRFLNLEPSLAMDWLEISWDDLHIKERIGAGMFALLLIDPLKFLFY